MRKLLWTIFAVALVSCTVEADLKNEGAAPVFPEYDGVTVPFDIAPLNISSLDGSVFQVTVEDASESVLLHSKGKSSRFPVGRWHKALSAHQDEWLAMIVTVKCGTKWIEYSPIRIFVSSDKIDFGLTYRLIQPGYQVYGKMGLYERKLSDFTERVLFDNRMIDANCLNCHTPNRTFQSEYSFHVRGSHSATMLHHDGITECLNTVTPETGGFFVYPSWHPSGKYIAYSVNTTRQQFYSHSDRRVEVYDEKSDVVVYEPLAHSIIRPEILNRENSFETFPSFSADGNELFFCSAPAMRMPEERNRLRYSLCRTGFDSFEKVDTLISASVTGKSISFPKPSYDGRFVMVTAADFGTFPIWHKEADLWILDLSNGEFRPLDEANSDNTESFHNWSSSSRWYVFSSRRGDGLYTRLYIGHVSEDGTFGKPFLLPQRDPLKYYDELMFSYNIPDFTVEKVNLHPRKASSILKSTDRIGVAVNEYQPITNINDND